MVLSMSNEQTTARDQRVSVRRMDAGARWAGALKALGVILLFGMMWTMSACSDGPKSCLKLTLMSAETQDSGLVSLFIRVECDGLPLKGLNESNFEIIENGDPISSFESQKRVSAATQSAGDVFRSYTMLMLDMSGSIVDSNSVGPLVEASKAFVATTVGEGASVGIFLFDGRSYIEELVPFTEDQAKLDSGLDSLANYQVVDRSTNLNGAIIHGVERLRTTQLYEDKALLTGATLVIFTDGTDRAQRYTNLEAQAAANDAARSGMTIYSVGLGVEVNIDELEALGQSGFEYIIDTSRLVDAFAGIAEKIDALNSGYYGVAYCSSARGGEQQIIVQVKYDNQISIVKTTFDAEIFGVGCNVDDADLTSIPQESTP